MSIKQDALDTYVRDLVRAAIADGRVAERLRAGSGDADEAVALVSSLETDLAALAEDHGAGRITRPEWMAAREPLTARLDAARRDLARRDGAESLALVSGGLDAWDRRWHEAGRSGLVDRQRAMLRAVMASVAVGPAVRGRNRFDPDRVSEPDWRA